ncbi:MAG TPA: phosphoribosyltransferase family protein [Candidatus Acidoferrales bacterium]|nr:phosphoribosyltransferase family protein [Candidatus Acidoferrales bacterium]
MAARLSELVAGEAERFAADVIVPVPLHRDRRRERGFNQAELITRPLAGRLRLPVRAELLARVKPRPESLQLTRRQRWHTVRGAFAVPEHAKVDKLRILLVDDVMTTGATLDACSRALLRAGAAEVVALTVARAVSNWAPVPTSDANSAS